jgi:hypothetical protein
MAGLNRYALRRRDAVPDEPAAVRADAGGEPLAAPQASR